MVLALGGQREAGLLKLLASHLVNQQVQDSAGDPDPKNKLENDKRPPTLISGLYMHVQPHTGTHTTPWSCTHPKPPIHTPTHAHKTVTVSALLGHVSRFLVKHFSECFGEAVLSG